MSWFFRKKEGVSKREFNELINSIKNSFSNVKKDISTISGRTEQNEGSLNEVYNIINQLNNSLSNLNNRINLLESKPKTFPKIEEDIEELQEEKIPPRLRRNVLDKITVVQEEILKKLAALKRERPDEIISAKDLAQEMYPETEYSRVRPMISNYLDILEELNLIKKIRKRRQVYAELTDKGDSLTRSFPQQKIKFSKFKKTR